MGENTQQAAVASRRQAVIKQAQPGRFAPHPATRVRPSGPGRCAPARPRPAGGAGQGVPLGVLAQPGDAGLG